MNRDQRTYLLRLIDSEEQQVIHNLVSKRMEKKGELSKQKYAKFLSSKKFIKLDDTITRAAGELSSLLESEGFSFSDYYAPIKRACQITNVREYATIEDAALLKALGPHEVHLSKLVEIKDIASNLRRQVIFPEKDNKLFVDAFEQLVRHAFANSSK